MPRLVAIITFVTVTWLHAAELQTRAGRLFSGNLEKINSDGVRLAGKNFKWPDILRVRLKPAPRGAVGLSGVSTRIWRGKHLTFPDKRVPNPSLVDTVGRHYLDVRSVDNKPGAILFEGKLNVSRAGKYHFRLGSDDGARILIGGKEVLFTPAEYSFRRAIGSVQLEPGAHDIRLEYINLSGYAILHLEWSGPNLGWSNLSATYDGPMPAMTPAIPSAGVLTWNGSFIAYPVHSLSESKVNFIGNPKGIRLSTVNATAIFFQPLSLPFADRIRLGETGREGVLLTTGDFQGGEIASIKDNIITVKTVLFGEKEFKTHSEAAAVFLGNSAKPRDQWRVYTRAGGEFCLRKLNWEGSDLVGIRAPFKGHRLKANDIREIAFLSEPNVLKRSWDIWKQMDEQQRHQVVNGQGYFNEVYMPRSVAQSQLAKLDAKKSQLILLKSLKERELAFSLKNLQSVESAVRKAHLNWSSVQNKILISHVRVGVGDRRSDFGKEFKDRKTRRLEDAKKLLAEEKKKLADLQEKFSDFEIKFKNIRARQQELYKNDAAAKQAVFGKLRALFKGDFKPVQIIAATAGTGKVLELAEARRLSHQRWVTEFTTEYNNIVRQRDDAKRKMEVSKNKYQTAKRTLVQFEANVANLLKTQLIPSEQKNFQFLNDYSNKDSVHRESSNRYAANGNSVATAKLNVSVVSQHVRDLDASKKRLEAELSKLEQAKSNTLRDRANKLKVFEAAQKALDQFVDQHEKPALKRWSDTKARHDKLAEEVKGKPDEATLLVKLTQGKARVASDLKALTVVRSNLNGLLGRFQAAQHSYSQLLGFALKMQANKCENKKAEIMLTAKYLAVKKSEEANLKKIAAKLGHKETESRNMTRKAKADKDHAMTVMNKWNADHARKSTDYHSAINKRFNASRIEEDHDSYDLRDQSIYNNFKKQTEAVYQELERRKKANVSANKSKLEAEKRHRASDVMKAAFKAPLTAQQASLLAPYRSLLIARSLLAQYQTETGLELLKIQSEHKARLVRYQQSVAGADALLKNAMLKDTAAVAEFDKLGKELVVLKKSYEDAQVRLKAAETEVNTLLSNMAESTRAFGGAQLILRDKSRELVESEFVYQRHRVTEHSKLGLH